MVVHTPLEIIRGGAGGKLCGKEPELAKFSAFNDWKASLWRS
jgi:hypothetical protein